MTTQYTLQQIWVNVKYLLWYNFWCYLQMYNCLAQRKAPAKVIRKLGCRFAICIIVMGIALLSYSCEWESVRFVHSGSKVHAPWKDRHSNQLLKTHTQQEFLEIYPHADVSVMVGILHVGLISFQVLFGTMGDLCTYVQYIWSCFIANTVEFPTHRYMLTSNTLDLWKNLCYFFCRCSCQHTEVAYCLWTYL